MIKHFNLYSFFLVFVILIIGITFVFSQKVFAQACGGAAYGCWYEQDNCQLSQSAQTGQQGYYCHTSSQNAGSTGFNCAIYNGTMGQCTTACMPSNQYCAMGNELTYNYGTYTDCQTDFNGNCLYQSCSTWQPPGSFLCQGLGGDLQACSDPQDCITYPPCNIGACNAAGAPHTNMRYVTGASQTCGGWYTGNGWYYFNSCPCTNNPSSCSSCGGAGANTCSNNGSQTCTNTTNDVGSTYCSSTAVTQTCSTNNCNATYTCPSGTCVTTISGNVFKDLNHNGAKDAEDTGLPTVTVSIAGQPNQTTDANGNFTFPNLPAGNYSVSITVPAGYQVTTTNPVPVTLGSAATIQFGLTPIYTISGEICNDSNIDGSCMEADDTQLANATSVTINPVTADGTTRQQVSQAAYLAGVQVLSGTYTVSYSPANGYYFTASKIPNKTAPPFTISVGASSTVDTSGNKYTCTVPAAGSSDASCASGSIVNLNFAVSNLEAWIQGVCTDMRLEAPGSDVHLPNNGTCGGVSNSYAVVCQDSKDIGIYYGGDNSPTFGSNGGTASQSDFLVADPYPSTFNQVSGVNRTTYDYLIDTANSAGLQLTDLSGIDPNSGLPYCGGGGVADCNFEPTLPDGVYVVPNTPAANNGNLVLDLTSQIPDPGNYKSYVFLVSGTIEIKSDVLVPNTTSAIFAAKGDINVDGNVGQPLASYTSTTPDLEGLYSTEGNFNILSNANGYACGPGGVNIDKRLNIVGSVVTGGTVVNSRELCKYDADCPVTTYEHFPPYLLNAPDFIKHKTQLWQEQAPGGN